MKKIFLLIVTILLVCYGCSKDDDNPAANSSNPSLTGNWTGTGDNNLTVEIDLTQNGTSVSGTGTMQGTLACTISGSNNYPGVDLKFFVNNVQNIAFSGSFSDDNTVSGKYTSSGFSSYDLKLIRN